MGLEAAQRYGKMAAARAMRWGGVDADTDRDGAVHGGAAWRDKHVGSAASGWRAKKRGPQPATLQASADTFTEEGAPRPCPSRTVTTAVFNEPICH